MLDHQVVDTAQHWQWIQHWSDVLFLHWRVPADLLQNHVPGGVQLDLYDGDAWVSLIVFRLRVRPTWLPYLPGLSNLVEVNLRTYVRCHDLPGICFLSVHAHNRLAIFLARLLTPMPYHAATMSYSHSHFCANAGRYRLELDWHCHQQADETRDGTIDAWLLEAYRLFIAGRRERMQEAQVDHPRWQISDAEASIHVNTAGELFGLDLGRAADLAHFSRGVEARFSSFRETS